MLDTHAVVRVHADRTASVNQTLQSQPHKRSCIGAVRKSAWRRPARTTANTRGRHGFVIERPGIWKPPNSAACNAATPSRIVTTSATRTQRGRVGTGAAFGGPWSLRNRVPRG